MIFSLSWQAWANVAMISILVFIMNIDYTAVNLALVPIAKEMDENLNTLQWLLSGYVLVWAALVVPGGRLADLYGKQKIIITGLIIFILGSAITGWGNTIELLIIGRLFQGIGAALFSAPAYGLIFTSVPSAQQGMVMGIIGGATGLGLATGPSLAGLIISEVSWRWLFYINIPLCLLIIGGLIFFNEKTQESQTGRLDYFSVGLLGTGLGLIVFALNQIEEWGIKDVSLLGLLFIGLCCLGGFWWQDQRQQIRLLPSSLLKNKGFVATLTVGFLYTYCFALILIMLSLYMQNILQLSSEHTGRLFLAMTISLGVLSPIGGKIADRLGIHIPVLTGAVLILMSLIAFYNLPADSSSWLLILGLLLAGLGLGIGFPSLNTAMFRSLNPQEINTGSGVFTMIMMLGNCISVIISSSLLVGVGTKTLVNLETAHNLNVTAAQQETLLQILKKVGHTVSNLTGFSDLEKMEILITTSFLYGFKATLSVGIILIGVGLFIAYRALQFLPSSSKEDSSSAPPLF